MREYNKEQAEDIAKQHIANTTEILDISDSAPDELYNPFLSNDLWYVKCSRYASFATGPSRVICVSKKTGKVVSDQLVGE